MKNLIYIGLFGLFIIGCTTSKTICCKPEKIELLASSITPSLFSFGTAVLLTTASVPYCFTNSDNWSNILIVLLDLTKITQKRFPMLKSPNLLVFRFQQADDLLGQFCSDAVLGFQCGSTNMRRQ